MFQVVTVAIDVVGSLVILTGGLILIGAVAVTKFQRVYEAAIFKTLGASSRDDCRDADGRIRPARDACRGGRVVRRAGPGLGRQPVTRSTSRGGPVLHENLIGTVATSLLIMIIGVAASADVLKRKPLAALRAE